MTQGIRFFLVIFLTFWIFPVTAQNENQAEVDSQNIIQSFQNDFKLSDLPVTITSIATVVFVFLLYLQLRRQRTGDDLTIRPIITLDKNSPDSPPPIYHTEGRLPLIRLRLINVGSIATGKTRVMLLPPDDHAGFVRREKALKKYVKRLKGNDLRTTESCMVLNPIRVRIKSSIRSESSDKYLVVGDDLGDVRTAKSEFDSVLDRMKDKKAKFNDAGKERAKSLANLNPDDWDKFYQAGIKQGDLLDVTGPVDWESFDSGGSITQKDVENLLGEDAKRIYNSGPDRKKILDNMSKEDRECFDVALKKRQDIWNSLSSGITHDFAKTSMNLRKAYKSIKDIHVRELSLLAPDHPIYLDILLDESALKMIESNGYVYFGALLQYGKIGDKKRQFAYYIQGYYHDKNWHMDYTLDFLDA